MLIAQAGESQTLKFIARSLGQTGSVILVDEQTNEVHSFLAQSYGNDRHYTTVEMDLSSLTSERMYLMKVNCVPGEIYRGKLFLTSQDPDDYSINSGVYSQPTADNEYLVV